MNLEQLAAITHEKQWIEQENEKLNREREELEQMKASQLKAAKEIEQKKATLHKQKMDEEIKTRALEEVQRHVANEQSEQNNIAEEKEHVWLKEAMEKIQRERK